MAPISKKTSETKQTVQVVEQPAVESKQKKTKAKTAVQEQAVAQSAEQPSAEPKQKKTKAKTVVQEQAVAQVVEQPAVEQSTEAPVVQEKKKRASSKKQAKPVETSVEVTEQSSEASESVTQGSTEKRSRKVVNQETLRSDLEQLKQQVEDEIQRLRTSEQKNKGVKFLKNVNRSLKVLQSDLNKVLKSKVKTVRSKNTSSGFMKPVKISSEMALFTAWDSSNLYSRVDVTKFLCKYIKDNTLQNPEDRRQILCDEKLASLLKIDTATSAPLTYPGLQQYIQQHFIPLSEETVVSEETAKP
jgi:upstream activation factor subunit UAF30